TNYNVQYTRGIHVALPDTNNKLHRYVALTIAVSGAPTPGGSAEWRDETDAPIHVPLILDAWNNPIIFVPGSGLRVRLLNGKKSLDPADNTQTYVIQSPDKRPFFASAGPDGDFAKGDDNIYSFEQ